MVVLTVDRAGGKFEVVNHGVSNLSSWSAILVEDGTSREESEHFLSRPLIASVGTIERLMTKKVNTELCSREIYATHAP